MFFKEAYEALKQGAIVKLPEWAGYWRWRIIPSKCTARTEKY